VKRPILYILALLLLSSCGIKRQVVAPPAQVQETSRERFWVPDADVEIIIDEQPYRCNVDLKLVKDSIIVFGIYGMPGMEIARVQLMPDSVVLVDKVNKRYILATWEELRQHFSIQLDDYATIEKDLFLLKNLVSDWNVPFAWYRHFDNGNHHMNITLNLKRVVTDHPMQIRPIKTEGYRYMTINELWQ